MKLSKFTILFICCFISQKQLFCQGYQFSTFSNGIDNSKFAISTVSNYQRNVALYPAPGFVNEIYNGDSIISIAFEITQASNIPVNGDLLIYFSNTNDLRFNKDSLWSNIISNMELVFDDTITIPNTSGLVEIPFNQLFNYSGEGIYLAYQWTRLSPPATSDPFYKYNDQLIPAMNQYYSNISHSTILGTEYIRRPSLKIKYKNQPNDISLSGIKLKDISCNSDSFTIETLIINKGSSTIDSLYLEFKQFTNSQVFVDSVYVPANLNSGDTLLLNNSLRIKNDSIYKLAVVNADISDLRNENDSIFIVFSKSLSINQFPYVEDFETKNHNWFPVSNEFKNTWVLSGTNKLKFKAPINGSKAWYTDSLYDYSPNHQSFVLSPCFDFSSIDFPTIKLDIQKDLVDNIDAVSIESSIDDGISWQKIGRIKTGENWYNDSSISPASFNFGWTGLIYNNNGFDNWTTSKHPLLGLGGKDSVRLRLKFESLDFGTGDGFAFDNIKIFNEPLSSSNLVGKLTDDSEIAIAPDGVNKYFRSISLYDKSEMTNGSLDTIIGVSISPKAISESVSGQVKVYLGNSNDSIFNIDSIWINALNNLDLVFNGLISIDSANPKMELRFDSFYTLNGSSFYMAIDWESDSISTIPVEYYQDGYRKNITRNTYSNLSKPSVLNDISNSRPIFSFLYPKFRSDLSLNTDRKQFANCILTNSESINLFVTNYGSGQSDTTSLLLYQIYHNNSLIDSGSHLIPSLYYNEIFKTELTRDFSVDGVHNIKAFIRSNNDEDKLNDTINIEYINLYSSDPCFSPYLTSFEIENQNWVTSGINSSWEIGKPNMINLDSSFEGSKSIMTNLDGDYRSMEESYLYSPCFDLSNGSLNLDLSFNLWMQVENNRDGLILEASIDKGNNWLIVGTINSGSNWYNSNSPNLTYPLVNAWTGDTTINLQSWNKVYHDLSNFASSNDIVFRFKFISDYSDEFGGVAIDYFHLDTSFIGNPISAYSYLIDTNGIQFTDNSSCDVVQWSWDFGDGTFDSIPNPYHTYSSAGSYNVCLIVRNLQITDTFCSQITVSGEINDNLNQRGLEKFPNPSRGIVNFRLYNISSINISELRIFDFLGNEIKYQSFKGNTNSVDISDLPAGIYIYNLKSNEYDFRGKIIKQ